MSDAVEREKCAKIAEGRAIFHRAEGRMTQAKEAAAIAEAIRSRSLYPDDGAAAKRPRAKVRSL